MQSLQKKLDKFAMLCYHEFTGQTLQFAQPMNGDGKGGQKVSEETKKLGAALAEALEALPEHKREYILGFAEGVAAMAAAKAERTPEQIGA